jgi:hypothetical protein
VCAYLFAHTQSVLMQNKRELTQAVFFQGLGDPEVYPRPKGEVYVTGFPGESPAFLCHWLSW